MTAHLIYCAFRVLYVLQKGDYLLLCYKLKMAITWLDYNNNTLFSLTDLHQLYDQN